MNTKRICFDLDGCLVNLYGVPNWLKLLRAESPIPYKIAEPLVNLSLLARYLNKVQRNGIEIVVISWLSKCGSNEYNSAVTGAKIAWLERHLPSVHWNEIHIVPYGTPKQNYCHCADDVLFDDTIEVRNSWTGRAFPETAIFEVLKELV